MYILIVDLIKQPEEVAPFANAHGTWVKRYFDEGIFLAAGPKKNKLGGAILAKSIDRAELNRMIAEDPYVSEAVAEYRVIEIDCKITTDALSSLKMA